MPVFGGYGLPDSTFGTNGKIYTDFGTENDIAEDVAVQPDGKIVVVGHPTNNTAMYFGVSRYNTDGSIDSSFGTNGKVMTLIFDNSGAVAVAIQPDGKIIVVGSSRLGQIPYFAIVRYNSDGTPDSTFGTNGVVAVSMANSSSYPSSVALQTDGKIVVGGRSTRGSSNEVFTLARFNINGTLDTTFDGDGILTTVFGTMDWVNDVAIQPDGKIIAVGFAMIGGNLDFALARYFPNGVLDTSFDSDGKVTTPVGTDFDGAFSVLLQPDGKILVSGSSRYSPAYNQMAIVRYNANGSLDSTFDGDGKATVKLSTTNTEGYGLAIQPDGKIIGSGIAWYDTSNGSDAVLARFTPTGALDPTFDGDGKLKIHFGSAPYCGATRAAIQPNGRILLAGYGSTDSNSDFAIARIYIFAPTAADFDGDQKSDLAIFRPDTGDWWYKQTTDNSVNVQNFGLSTDIPAPADYDGDGRADIAVWRSGDFAYFYILQSRTQTVRLEQFGQTGDSLLVGDYDGDGKADPAVYRDYGSGNQSYFFYRGSFNNPSQNVTYIPWGVSGDYPVGGDFNADSKNDFAIYRNGVWWILLNGGNGFEIKNWGAAADIPVAADFDGDGAADLAVFRPTDQTWYIQQSFDGNLIYPKWGLNSDVLIPADFDGDGKADPAVYRPSDNTWYVLKSGGGNLIESFGKSGDIPAQMAFMP